MEEIIVPYQLTGYFNKTIIDYLNDDAALRKFYSYKPEINSFAKAISDKSLETIDRELLADTITNQYENIPISDAVKNNIESFRSNKTFCVVTAHQLNIFSGPLYVIYKSLSAVALCKTLEAAYPEYHFVPVFWLGSEDHDFEEIAHFHLFGKTFTWTDDQGGACGRYDPSSLSDILGQLKAVMGESDHAQYLSWLFENAYLHAKTLSQSARIILNTLLGKYGIVIVDGDEPALKSACSNIIEDELFNNTSSKIVRATIENFPHEAQAKPRDINLFYLAENIRERIVFDAARERFEVLNTNIHFSKQEMLNEIKNNISAFSPNVILRPLFQQKVLPAVSFIGGGGEIAYWLQLRSLFENYKVQFPVLFLRNSLLIIDRSSAQKMKKLGIQPQDIFQHENDLINRYAQQNSLHSTDLSAEKETLEKVMHDIADRSAQIDPTLYKSALAEKQNVLASVQKLEAKLLKAEKAKMETEINQIRSLKNKLFPLGGLQERHDTIIGFYLENGEQFISDVAQSIRQPSAGFVILVENE